MGGDACEAVAVVVALSSSEGARVVEADAVGELVSSQEPIVPLGPSSAFSVVVVLGGSVCPGAANA